jgi:ribosomal protein S18 acetylase RimI-like enzyme
MNFSDRQSETIRMATPSDIDMLIPLMRGYYRDDGLDFDEQSARMAMLRLLSEPQWGFVLLAEIEQVAVGYIVLCQSFSLEFGGNDGYLDELFVDPDFRGRGVAQRLVDALEVQALERGLVAVHLEVDRDNEVAQQLYAARDYDKRDRYFVMSQILI